MRPPSFQFYPADFLADKNTICMSAAEVGAYWLLICVCWREGELPPGLPELAAMSRTHLRRFEGYWEKHLKRCFIQKEDGKWTHKRLEQERLKQKAFREKMQEAGEKGAKLRWQKDRVGHSQAIASDSSSPSLPGDTHTGRLVNNISRAYPSGNR